LVGHGYGKRETPETRQVLSISWTQGRGTSLWWENLQNAKRRQVQERIRMWTKMLRHLKANLCPKINSKYF